MIRKNGIHFYVNIVNLNDVVEAEEAHTGEVKHAIHALDAFRDGEIKTTGTDIDKLMPPVSRFGGGKRAEKKQTVIEKLKAFFERFFGIGGSSFKSEVRATSPIGIQQDIDVSSNAKHKAVTYELTSQPVLKVAESPTEYK